MTHRPLSRFSSRYIYFRLAWEGRFYSVGALIIIHDQKIPFLFISEAIWHLLSTDTSALLKSHKLFKIINSSQKLFLRKCMCRNWVTWWKGALLYFDLLIGGLLRKRLSSTRSRYVLGEKKICYCTMHTYTVT